MNNSSKFVCRVVLPLPAHGFETTVPGPLSLKTRTRDAWAHHMGPFLLSLWDPGPFKLDGPQAPKKEVTLPPSLLPPSFGNSVGPFMPMPIRSQMELKQMGRGHSGLQLS